MKWQIDAVTSALEGADPIPPVMPVLCFLEADWPLFGAPDEFRGVRLESRRSLKRLIVATAVLDETRINEVTAILAAKFPPK